MFNNRYIWLDSATDTQQTTYRALQNGKKGDILIKATGFQHIINHNRLACNFLNIKKKFSVFF